MPASSCYQPWSFMEIRDLFGDGDVAGDLVREACLNCSTGAPTDGCTGSERAEQPGCRFAQSDSPQVLRIDPTVGNLPRQDVLCAIRKGLDIVLEFPTGFQPAESLLREIAILVRRLRTSGLTLSLAGLAHPVRARISSLEVALGRS
jgi:hypothetical protein